MNTVRIPYRFSPNLSIQYRFDIVVIRRCVDMLGEDDLTYTEFADCRIADIIESPY